MISICSEVLVSCLYKPEGYADMKCSTLTPKDKRIYGIPNKLAYLDLITGLALLIVGVLALHNVIALSGASYFIGFGSAQLAIGLIFKLLSMCCPCLGAKRWADNGEVGNLIIIEQGQK